MSVDTKELRRLYEKHSDLVTVGTWRQLSEAMWNALPEMLDELDALREFAAAVVRYGGNAGDDYLADMARKALSS